MSKVEEYREHARACRELAARTTQQQDKVALEKLAKAWDKVAVLRKGDLEDPDES